MTVSSDIPENELHLARLVCSKLTKLLQGMLSVGLSSMLLDCAKQFLEGREKLIFAFVAVLSSTGVKPNSGTAIELKDKTTRLSELIISFFSYLMTLANWRTMKKEELFQTSGQLAITYSALLSTLQELLQLLGVTTDYSQTQFVGKELIDGVTTEIAKRMET